MREVNLLIAMNKDTIDKHKHKLSDHAGIIYDGDYTKLNPSEIENSTVKLYSVPLYKIANENGGKIMRNTVALGATMALIDFDMEIFNKVISDNFGTKKGTAIVDANVKAARAGYDYIKNNFPDDFKFRLEKKPRQNNMFMSGNEAITVGMVKAGCKFYAAYPMTPASSLLSNMAGLERQFNLVVKHTEDEIAAINMAIGASYAGVRSACGTSGGGFALMVEGFGHRNPKQDHPPPGGADGSASCGDRGAETGARNWNGNALGAGRPSLSASCFNRRISKGDNSTRLGGRMLLSHGGRFQHS